ncbi:MAG: UDP-N-acetylmuramoyl-tripeptide--D-alanyl-D-alanine ligase [Desulfuromonadaceae bacterium]|nr:UDP-N-acetylmuramoyl-tripeptide--D-alanyl-D-alanine ligase [Desulfuromonadaceae bacterium]
MQWDSEEIESIVSGRLLGAPYASAITGISTDSRTLQSGDLFVPLRGPNYDGHNYLRQAVEYGAAACLSEEVIGGLPVPVIQVDDTLEALGALAASIRAAFAGPVAAITGTSGKTSTKEMLASILTQCCPGLKTAGNFNNLIGLPLTLAGLAQSHRWMVLEMGMNHPGEIRRLSAIARPSVALITNAGAGHLEGLGSVAAVAKAKAEIFEGLIPGGVAVLNADDPELMALQLPDGVRRVTYGIKQQSDVMATNIRLGRQVDFSLHLGDEVVEVSVPLPGRHQVHNALAAAAVARVLGGRPEHIAAGLRQVKMAAGRLEVRELDAGITVLDDSYNANPQSMLAALEVLEHWPVSGRRIAVLADMLELGDAAAYCHAEVGSRAAQVVDHLLCYGQWSTELIEGARQQGLEPTQVARINDHEDICAWLTLNVQPYDCLLVKGSRGMRMERIVDFLLHKFRKVA